MTFTEILKNYPKQDFPSHEDLCVIVVDILRVLAENEPKEERQTIEQHKEMYKNDNLWKEICAKQGVYNNPSIELIVLRTILEKYQILESEKDGM